MPKVTIAKVSTKKKPYTRTIIKLKQLRDLQGSKLSNSAKMDDEISGVSVESSPALDNSTTSDGSQASVVAKKNPTNKDIMAFLESMKKQQCTKDDLSKLETAMSSKIDEVKSTAEENTGKIRQLAKRLDKFETTANMSSYNNELQKQRQLKTNVCIMGIPPFEKELPIDTAASVFKAIECDISSASIATAYRTKGKASIIVVKLANYEDKIKILNAKASKIVRVSDIADCDASVASNFVYVNNHVTPYFGKLLKEGRDAVKNKQIHSCWLSSSGCMLKLAEDGPSMGFNTSKEFQKIIKERPSTSESNKGKPVGKRGKPDDNTNHSAEQKTKQRRSNKTQ